MTGQHDAELERRLRSALHAQARAVAPDPGTWEVVQRRIRRGTALRAGATGLVAVALVAALVVAVPELLRTRRDIDFAPATVPPAVVLPAPSPSASPPPASPAPASPPPASPFAPTASAWSGAGEPSIGALVVDRGDRLMLQTIAGDEIATLAEGSCAAGSPTAAGPAVRPGSTPAGLVVAALAPSGECGDTLELLSYSRSSGVLRSRLALNGCCATAPVWAPDGASLAWVMHPPGEGPRLVVADVVASPGQAGRFTGTRYDVDVAAGLSSSPGAGPLGTDARVVEWTGEAAGRGRISVAAPSRATIVDVAVRREGDGGWDLSGPVRSEPGTDLERSGAGTVVDWVVTADASRLEVVRGDGVRVELETSVDVAAAGGPVWLDAVGTTGLVGNGDASWAIDSRTGTVMSADIEGPVVAAALVPDAGDWAGPGVQSTVATATPAEPGSTTTVGVAFLAPDGWCGERIAVVERRVAAAAPLRGALEALLAGPTVEERRAGLVTALGDGPDLLRSVSIADGIATVDIDDAALPGNTSCQIFAVTAQLDATVSQFATVDRATYALEGSVEDFAAWAQSDPASFTARPVP